MLTALGTLAFTQAGPATNEWLLAGSLFVRGAGLAGATIAVMAGAFQGVPRDDVPDASGATRIVQQVGGSFGAAVPAVILAHSPFMAPRPPPSVASPSTPRFGGFRASRQFSVSVLALRRSSPGSSPDRYLGSQALRHLSS